MANNKRYNQGFYISQREYLEEGVGATVYVYSEHGWLIANTGERVTEADLPEAPESMWPLRLLQR